jgi:putative aldouronate transport system permease protein
VAEFATTQAHKPLQLAAARRNESPGLRALARHWQLYAMLALPLLWLAIFRYLPMANAIIAFKNFSVVKGIWGSDWVGLKNFQTVLNNPVFFQLLGNTFQLSLYYILASFPIPIIIALCLNELRSRFFRQSVQMVIYAPYFISTVVIVSMTLLTLSPRTGLIAEIYGLFGMAAPDLLSRADYFRHIYVWSEIWTVAGYFTVLYVAALSAIDPALYDAAKIDGASRLQRIVNVDLPGISPLAVTLLLLGIGNVMNIGFEKAFLLQNPVNLAQSEILPTYVYKTGLLNANYSVATVVNLLNAAINLVAIVAVNFLVKRATGRGLW